MQMRSLLIFFIAFAPGSVCVHASDSYVHWTNLSDGACSCYGLPSQQMPDDAFFSGDETDNCACTDYGISAFYLQKSLDTFQNPENQVERASDLFPDLNLALFGVHYLPAIRCPRVPWSEKGQNVVLRI